jgi:hypothetical protein
MLRKRSLSLILLFSLLLTAVSCGGTESPANDDTQTAAPSLASNDGRVKFLESLGWQVTASPKESGQVRIPEASDEVFDRYNALQKSQGYDLTPFAGKTVMRYVYQVKNFPNATDPVYATLLIYKDQVIGGDITDTAPTGAIQGLKSTLP